jgi:hypothetical protein
MPTDKENKMRKVIVFNRISLDGFFAGPQGEIDWFVQDDEYLLVITPVVLGKSNRVKYTNPSRWAAAIARRHPKYREELHKRMEGAFRLVERFVAHN